MDRALGLSAAGLQLEPIHQVRRSAYDRPEQGAQHESDDREDNRGRYSRERSLNQKEHQARKRNAHIYNDEALNRAVHESFSGCDSPHRSPEWAVSQGLLLWINA